MARAFSRVRSTFRIEDGIFWGGGRGGGPACVFFLLFFRVFFFDDAAMIKIKIAIPPFMERGGRTYVR